MGGAVGDRPAASQNWGGTGHGHSWQPRADPGSRTEASSAPRASEVLLCDADATVGHAAPAEPGFGGGWREGGQQPLLPVGFEDARHRHIW